MNRPDAKARPDVEPLDLAERGGRGATSDRRLFVQLQAFTGCIDTATVIETLDALKPDGVLYEDALDPTGIALVTCSEDEADFTGKYRQLLQSEPFARYEMKPAMTMFGRTYAIGYEPDLDDTLIERPKRALFKDDAPWAVWYPLRRKGGFQQLPIDEQKAMLMEHGSIGRRFAEAGAASDIRLACHGLDRADNDFVVGLVGARLAPLSKLVETMRKTRQTSDWLESLGPFFVGQKVWQSGR